MEIRLWEKTTNLSISIRLGWGVLGHLPDQNVSLPMAVGTESATERNRVNFQR